MDKINQSAELLNYQHKQVLTMAKQKKLGVPSFVRKLSLMMEDAELASIIRWDKTGSFICVLSVPRLESLVLPIYFRHSKFSSFVRQLNMYGFSKCKPEKGVASSFSNPLFQRGSIDLSTIEKKPVKTISRSHEPHQHADQHSENTCEDHLRLSPAVTEGEMIRSHDESKNSQVCQMEMEDQPEICELLAELQSQMWGLPDDLLWMSEMQQVLNRSKYRRVEHNFRDLWHIESSQVSTASRRPLKMELIL